MLDGILPDALLVRALNHLLRQQAWARTRLQAHAGQCAQLNLGGLALCVLVSPEGLLERAANTDTADVAISLPLQALTQGPEQLTQHAQVTGNAHFAETLSLLLQHLRPDLGASLSPYLGDALAHRAELTLQGAVGYATALLASSRASLSEYLRDESHNGPLGQSQFHPFRAELDDTVQRLRQLEKRLAKRS